MFDRNFSGSILQSFSSSEGRWIIVVILLGDFLFILANVYGFNNHTQNSSFFHDLSSKIFDLKSKYPSAAVIVGGDLTKLPTYVWIDFLQNQNHADVIPLLMIFVTSFLYWMPTGLCMLMLVHILGLVQIS